MDIIIVSNRFAKAYSITLGGRHLLMAALLAGGLLFAAGFAVQRSNAGTQPITLVDGQQKQQSYMHEGLNAMAVRLGQMQAQLLRLDTLGARLAKLNGMKPQEFNFDQPPAQGGPYVPAMQQDISLESLNQQLDRLSALLNDRNDKLVALETLQLQNRLNKKLLPSRPPVIAGMHSSNFGWRIDPFTGQNAMHEGVDFMVPEGTPIQASAGGIVVYSDFHPQYGKMVEIDHGNDIVTRYAHASSLLVKVGEVVRRGQEIARVGSTGRSTGSHLHFEVRYKGIAQNPQRFLQDAAG
ncbi:Murein DD-endopeptidase MepM [Rhodocyclaceae bacterium]|nr:Murein DD-endopeptidase MepM [Rhodocyclaceae bacterium]